MKNEKIKEFLTRLAQEEGFKVEFLKLKEKVEKKGFSKKDNEKFISECLLPWSKKLGYKLTKKDFIDFDRTQKPTEITGLSPAELKNVSGGAFPMLFALFAMFGSALAGGIGGGDSTNKNQKKGQDSFSTSLTQYQQADGGETTLAMLRDGHRIGDIILDAYAQQEDVLPDSSAGLLDWDGYHQGAADGANADASSQQVQPAPAGDIYSPIKPSTGHDVPEQTGTAEGTSGSTAPTMSDWTQDPENFKDPIDGKLVENDSEADFNNPFAGREPIYTQPGLDSSADAVDSTVSTGGIVEDPMLLSNNRVVLLNGLDTLDKELNTVGGEHQGKLRDNLNTIKDKVNSAPNIDVLEEIELEMDKLKAAIQTAAGTTPVDFRSGAATGAGATSASSDAPSDWTTDQDYLSSAQRFEGTENTSEVDFNNPFAGREPIYTQPGLDSTVDNPAGSAPIGLIGYEQSSVGPGAPAGGIVEDPMLLSNNRVVLLKRLDTLDKEINTVGSEHQSKLRDKLNSIKDNVNGASNIDVLEEIELEMDKLKAAIQTAAGKTQVEPGSGTAAGGDGGQSVLSQSPQTPNNTPVGTPMFTQTNTTQGNSTLNATQNNTDSNTTQGRSSFTSKGGPKLKDDLRKFATGTAIGLTAVAGAITAGSSKDDAQQNTNKTKETFSKSEEKKSTKAAKKEGNDFMRRFMKNLQTKSPETREYLESLKSYEE